MLLEKHAKELRQQLETVQNKYVEENQRHELAQQELNHKATLVKVCCQCITRCGNKRLMQDLESQLAKEEARRKKLQEEKELFESKERTTDGDIARLESLHEKMVEERNMLEEQVRHQQLRLQTVAYRTLI